MTDLPELLRSGCVGYPNALVKWPHRLLHEAADEIERLRAALEKTDETWQSMDLAPKDGTRILLRIPWASGTTTVEFAEWDDHIHAPSAHPDVAGWLTWECEDPYYTRWVDESRPTGWMLGPEATRGGKR